MAQQLEASGKHILFLAQKQPKRLLAVFACDYPVRPGAVQAVAALQGMGLELVILTGEQARIAKGVAAQLEIPLVQSELAPEEKRAIVQSLVQKLPESGFLCDRTTLAQVNGGVKVLIDRRGAEQADVSVQSLAELAALIETARGVLSRARTRFFWKKI